MKLARTIRDLMGPLGLLRLLLLLFLGLIALMPGVRMWLTKHVFLRGMMGESKKQKRIDK